MSVSWIADRLVSKIFLSTMSMFPPLTEFKYSLSTKYTDLRGELLEVLKSVEAASIDAEMKPAENNSEVKIWLEEAKYAIFDAEDLWEQLLMDDDQDKWTEQLREIIKKLQFLVKNERKGVEEKTDGSMNVVLAEGETEQLRELEKLNSLHRKLYVLNLNYITNIENVVIPSIETKEYLEELVLKWKCSFGWVVRTLDQEVLDAFRAHDNLQNLTISGYSGNALSTWIVGVAPSFRNLVSLCIEFCTCLYLPQLGNLPSLKDLTMRQIHRLETLGWTSYGESDGPFEALEMMSIDGMDMLRTWSFPKETNEGFSSLKVLRISKCPRLTRIPYLFSSLIKLHIQRCGIVEMETREAEKGVGQSLQSLQIRSCGALRSVPESFANLRDVCISDCKSLVSVPKQMLKLTYDPFDHAGLRVLQLVGLTGLQRLHLSIPDKYDSELSLPPNLSHLIIRGASFPATNKILLGLVNLKSLNNLELIKPRTLDSCHLPLLVSLKFLTIARCDAVTIPDLLLSGCSENLVELHIIDCPYLEYVTPKFCDLRSLQKLNIVRCPIIQLFPTSSSTGLNHLADLAFWKARMVSKLDSASNHPSDLAVWKARARMFRKRDSASSSHNFAGMSEGETSLLEGLMIQLYAVDAGLRDVERNPVEQHLKWWLYEARYAILNANDLLVKMLMDISEQNRIIPVPTKIVHSAESSRTLEFDKGYGSAKERLDDTRWIVYSAVDNFYYRWKNIIQIIHSYKKTREPELRDIIKRLQSLADEKHEIMESQHYLEEGFSASHANDTSKVYDRLRGKEEILTLLNSSDGNGNELRVISVFGTSGVGKSTLAFVLYNDDKISDIFDVKGWVCVSDAHEEKLIIQSLLKSINGQESKVDNNLELLQRELKESLRGKRYLLVLDDIFNDIQWDALQKHFSIGAPGSRIIVTTHSRNVMRIQSTSQNSYYELSKMSVEESWLLFEGIAFPNGNSNEQPLLKQTGMKIICKCTGLPLEIKMIGGLLHSKEVEANEWEKVLNSKDWDSTLNILPSLQLSYNHLSQPVQQCFTYLSLFPKGYVFTMEEIVILWVAEGLIVIEPNKRNTHTNGYEEVARTYFKTLCSNFFIQQVSSGFTVHALVHDLAVYMSRDVVIDLRNKNTESGRLHRLCYQRNQDENLLNTKSVQLQGIKDLHTFLSFSNSEATSGLYFNAKVLDDLLLNFKLLRVLSLEGYAIFELPYPVRDMKLLCYLNLSRTDVEFLPEWICDLQKLQVLNLSSCRKLKSLPRKTHNLVELRHLNIEGTGLKEMPDKIGNMACLRTLPIFVVNKGNSKYVEELGKLADLRGKLRILGLNNVVGLQEVVTANFGGKEYLEELILDWGHTRYRDTKLDKKVLDAIKPHLNLKQLSIKWYGGNKLSDWIVGLANIASLNISDCSNCRALPSLGDMSFLEDLTIEGLDCLEYLDEKFYGSSKRPFQALEKLKISQMEALKSWSFPPSDVKAFSSLKKLQIESCELKQVPYCFPYLIHLDITDCANLDELKMKGDGEADEFGKSLKFVDVKGCPELKKIPESFVRLSKVSIEVCHNLVEIPRLHSVQKLSLQYVGESLKVKDAIEECNNQVLRKLAIWLSSSKAAELIGAEAALLKPFTSLRRLQLEIEDDATINDEVILPPNVVNVFIRGGNFGIHTRILNQLGELKSLSHLEFFECHALESFPRVALPSTLKSLRIAICDGLKTIPAEFLDGCSKSLEDLDIFCCVDLEFLPGSFSALKSLQTLSLDGCPRIQQLPGSDHQHYLTNLSYLWISDCSAFESLPNRFHTTTSVLNLGLMKCPRLVFPEEGFPTNLKHLTIIDCDETKSISEMNLTKLASLTSLHLQGFTKTCTLEGCLPESVEDLTVRDFPNLKSLAEVLPTLKKLKKLDVEYCPLIKDGNTNQSSESELPGPNQSSEEVGNARSRDTFLKIVWLYVFSVGTRTEHITLPMDLRALYQRCHKLSKCNSAVACNTCNTTSSLAVCLDCNTAFCDGEEVFQVEWDPNHETVLASSADDRRLNINGLGP